jgi:hypothetical protein
MSAPESINKIVEQQLRQGETNRKRIVEAVLPACADMDCDFLRRFYADHRVSLIVGTMRNDDGERVAFPSRDSHGRRTIVHTDYTKDPNALMSAAIRLMTHGRNMWRAGKRLAQKAEQIRLDLQERKAA